MQQRFDIKPTDVFISYTKKQAKIKNKIVEFLTSKEITCLESEASCCGDYEQWSREAPKHCTIFMPIITEDTKTTKYMKDEFESFKDCDDAKNRILPICPDNQTYSKYSFGIHEWCSAIFDKDREPVIFCKNLTNGDISSKHEEVLSKIEKLLIHAKCRQNYSPPLPTNHFVGRSEILKEINEKLKECGTVFISGIGGIGKTELVKKYVKEYVANNTKTSDDIFNVIYLKYDKDSNLSSILRSVEKEMPIAKNFSVFNSPQTLVILDNFDTENDEGLDDFLSYGCKKIITTRYNGFEAYESKETITLDVLPYQEQYELFKTHYGYDIDAEDENVNFILNFISGLTVFIPILAKQCGASKMDLLDMYEKLKEGGVASFKDSEKFNINKDYISSTPGNALELARVIFKIAALEDKYITVLRNLSLLQFMYVNADNYKEICTNQTNENLNTLNDLIAKNWVIENRSSLSPKENTFELHPIINDLVREDLKPSPDNCPKFFENADKFFLKIEKLYEENNFVIGRNHEAIFDDSEKTEWLETFLNNLDLSIKDNYEYTAAKLKKIGFNQTLIIKLEKLLLQKDEIINQCDKEVAHYCLIHKGYENGVEILKKISKINQKDNPQIILNKFPDVMRAFFDIMLSRTNNNVLQMREASKDECNTMNEKLTYPSDEEFKKLLKKDMTFDECSVIINDIYKLKETKEEDFDYEYKNKFRSFIRVYLLCNLNVLPFNMCKSLIINSVDGVTDNTGILGSAVDDNRFEILIDALSHYMTQNYKEFETKMTEYLRKMIIDRNSIDFTKPLKEFLGKYKISSYYLIDVVHNYILFLEGSIQKENDFDLLCRTWYTWAYDLARDSKDDKYVDMYSRKLRDNKKTLLGYALK